MIVLLVISAMPSCDHQHKTRKNLNDMEVFGRWQKVTTAHCAEKYPDTIQFDSTGLYTTSPGNTPLHPVWDVGTFKIRGGSIDMSTSYDAVINYLIEVSKKKLSFKDPEGCIIEYKAL
jgi:hypothetical protein